MIRSSFNHTLVSQTTLTGTLPLHTALTFFGSNTNLSDASQNDPLFFPAPQTALKKAKKLPLQEKIKETVVFKNNLTESYQDAKKLIKKDPDNEYALIVLLQHHLKDHPLVEKFFTYLFQKQDVFTKYLDRLKNLAHLETYQAYLYLGLYNQFMILQNPEQAWEPYCIQAIEHFKTALEIAQKNVPAVEKYYLKVEKSDPAYDYSAVKNHKINQIHLHCELLKKSISQLTGLLNPAQNISFKY